jgi:hypothetical protein
LSLRHLIFENDLGLSLGVVSNFEFAFIRICFGFRIYSSHWVYACLMRPVVVKNRQVRFLSGKCERVDRLQKLRKHGSSRSSNGREKDKAKNPRLKWLFQDLEGASMSETRDDLNGYRGFEIRSPAMKGVYGEVANLAYHGRHCIFFGPSGAGKEYLARHYHREFSNALGMSAEAPFRSLNCAGLSRELTHSELFGHVKGAFTGAYRNKEGVFRQAEGGVLFLDEVGDLALDVQPMLHRALDPEHGEACPLGGSTSYKTTRVTVIAATEQPKEIIRAALLARFGAQVLVPGLEQRPEDLEPAISYFAIRSLSKRRDVGLLYQSFFSDAPAVYPAQLIKDPQLCGFANDVAGRLTPVAGSRIWLGNFRSLRVAVDTAIIRPRPTKDRTLFIEQVLAFFVQHLTNYSAPAGHVNARPPKAERDSPTGPKAVEGASPFLLEAMRQAMPHCKEAERSQIAAFLSQTKGGTFTRRDLEDVLPGMTARTLQSRLQKLVACGAIFRTGGRGDLYRLAEPFYIGHPRSVPKRSFFAPPPASQQSYPARHEALQAVHDLVDRSRGVFVGGENGAEKTALALTLASELSKTRDVFYYAFDTNGFFAFLELLDRELKARHITDGPLLHPENDETLAFQTALLSGYMTPLFGPAGRAVLILDNLDALNQQATKEAIRVMITYWRNLTFILLGKKMGNELSTGPNRALAEFRLASME